MAEKIAGFDLEVSVVEFIPHVRVTMENGTVVVDTDKVSCTGLENLSTVFKRAASIALKQFEAQSMNRVDDWRMETRRSKTQDAAQTKDEREN
jgi:hypothetical protein